MTEQQNMEMDLSKENYTTVRTEHWDNIAEKGRSKFNSMRLVYQSFLQQMYAFHIPQESNVLEIDCAEGDLLSSLKPKIGVGIDISEKMTVLAQKKHKGLTFITEDALFIQKSVSSALLDTSFDFIILSDVINDVWDVTTLLKNTKQFSLPTTRIIFYFHSHLYEHLAQMVQKVGVMTPRLQQSWFTPQDLENMLSLASFETVKLSHEFLFPFKIPLINSFFNRYLAKLWSFNIFCLTHFCVARMVPPRKEMSVSVLVPARNEAGNIEAALQRTPNMGTATEFIFVEGNSTDNTWEVIQEMQKKYAHKDITILQQPGKDKGDAVRADFAVAKNDILMILDADLTMPPESLPQFYEALASGKAEFANGVRLVYPQEKEAMRFCNLIANKSFGFIFSWLLGFSIKDTLCGTKVLTRENYIKLMAGHSYFGDFDPFGEFALIFGAAKMNLKFKDIPIRYRDRTYGDTNTSRWSHGWLLLKMVCFCANKIKFAPEVK